MASSNQGHQRHAGEPIRSEFADDPEMVDIVSVFLDNLEEGLRSLRACFAASEFDALQQAAHQIRGSGAGYGFPMLAEAAGRLEESIARGEDQLIRTAFEQLVNLCERARIAA